MYGQISLGHYPQGLNGFGTSSSADVDLLNKALEAGYALTNQTGGNALQVESLEQSLKVVTFTSKHIVLWKDIPKTPAYNLVEQYNQVTAYGGTEMSGFTRQGELPQAVDSSYIRRTALVKFIGTQREVTHQMTLVTPAHGDVVAQQNHDGILWVMQQAEQALYQGDSSLAFNGESEQWDGLDALIDVNSFVDLEGAAIQEADIEEAANQIVEAFGFPNRLYVGTRAHSDMIKTFYPRERLQLPAPKDGTVGMNFSRVNTSAGLIDFRPTVFLRQLKAPPAAATSPNAPLAPAALAANAVPYDVAGTAEWTKLLGTVTATVNFSYAVTACNRFGESAPAYLNRTHTIAAINTNQGFQMNCTNPAVVGANPPEFFRIYRTRPGVTSANPADFSEILKVPALTQANAGVNTLFATDRNFLIPFTEIAYMGQMDDQVLTFRQLAPMMKMDLAVLSPAYRWMILLYGTPILFAPRKWTRLINIGRV